MQLNKYYVYALVDPINRVPFYIGKGCGNRAFEHLRKTEKTNQKKIKYIQNIRDLGFEPRIEMIATDLTNDAAYELEAAMIAEAKKCFCTITNICPDNRPPSRKGIKLSDEQKKKISESLKGKSNVSWKGRKHSKETIDKMSEGMRRARARRKQFLIMGTVGVGFDIDTAKTSPRQIDKTETEIIGKTDDFLSKL